MREYVESLVADDAKLYKYIILTHTQSHPYIHNIVKTVFYIILVL